MKKQVIHLIVLLSVVFSISANSLPHPSRQFTDDIYYLTLGQTYFDSFYPNDRTYEIDLQMDDWSSFDSRTVSIRLNLHLDDSDSCYYSGFLTAVDAYDNWIQEYVDGEADGGWTDWLEVYVSIDVDQIDFDISHYCYDEIPGWFEIEILVEGEAPVTLSPIIDLWADEQTISQGSCTYINWDVTYASEVYFESSWVSDYGYQNVCPNYTTDYVLDVLGDDGYWYSRTLTIYVEEDPQPPPEVNFWANDTFLEFGECTTIYWEVYNASEVYFEGEWVYDSGVNDVCPESTTEYILDVLGDDGYWYSEFLTITLEEVDIDPPDIIFNADSYDLSTGDCTEIYWEAINAAEVYFNGEWVNYYGNEIVCPEVTTEFILDVLGDDGYWYASSFIIYVEEEIIPPPNISLYADAYDIFEGDCTTIYWEVRDAEKVYFDGDLVGNSDSLVVCPETTIEYALEVRGIDGETYLETITINVDESPVLEPDIEFWADDYQITEGECTTIYWDVVDAERVYVDGERKDFKDSQVVCPETTTDYRLEAYDANGNGLASTITIAVVELSCRRQGGFILIVTDSELLNRSTGNNTTWKDVKVALEDYYDSSADQCMGKAIFLDIAQLKKDTNPTYKFIDKQIEDFIKDMQVDLPAAVAIIGGPNVIPHEPPAELDPFHGVSDDIYADFDHDKLHSPDTVITRLPDGGSKDVLINYINALLGGRTPSGGALLVTDLKNSAHKLNYAQRSASITETASFSDDRFLEDYIALQKPGDITNLLTPPQVSQYRTFGTEYEDLLRVDDLANADPAIATQMNSSQAASGVRGQLDNSLIVFGDFAISNDLGYYLSNVSTQEASPTLYSPFSYADAAYFPEGAQVFSLTAKSALLDDPGKNGNIIPIAALNAGVQYFIGRTDQLPTYAEKKFELDDRSYWDLDLTQSAGRFAAEFFRTTSDDPATSFWDAKQLMYAENDPSGRYFLYLGLPERNDGAFGIYKLVVRLPHPKGSTVSIPPQPTGCPSGDFDDCDGDTIPDEMEYRLASTYVPYLIPDEDENQLPIYHSEGQDPFAVFWQVSPANVDGKEGAWITYVFSYTSDGGTHDFDVDFPDCAKCFAGTVIDYCECDPWPPWTKDALCCLSKVITFPAGVTVALTQTGNACTAIEIGIDQLSDFGVNYNVSQWLSFHPGDNEAFRVFVVKNNGTWSLTHVNWKRHHEGFDYESHLQTVAEAKADGLEFFEHSHPLLYVSEDKHAMYPTHEYCEGYEMNIKEYCKISFEHCSGHPVYTRENPIRTLILDDLNVGEADAHLFEDMGPVFPGENVWAKGEKDYFCGSLDAAPGLAEPGPCGGPMGKLWYITPSWQIEF